MFGYNFNTFFYNFIFSMLITFTGVFGLIITRLLKNNWSGQLWTYVPIFWLPLVTSWPIGLLVLFGGMNS